MTAGLADARRLAATGDYDQATHCYLALLRADPDRVSLLVELAAAATAGGYNTAALTAYTRAAELDPANPLAQTGCGHLLTELDDLSGAVDRYRRALVADPGFVAAHQGLARALSALGDPLAEAYWQSGFAGNAVVHKPCLGDKPGTPMLLLVSARGGNIATRAWIDDRRFAVTAVYADFHDFQRPLPPAALVVNAIGDADLCATALANAERIAAEARAPVINAPGRVRPTGRLAMAGRLAGQPGLVIPRMLALAREEVDAAASLGFPLLLRTPGFHTGAHFVRVERRDELAAAAAGLPGDDLLAIAYHDARGADGMARKYRVLFVDGQVYPLHLAIGAPWKLHYFSAAMAANAAFRNEERRFLTAMPQVLGPVAMAALARVQSALGLDYAGADFALSPAGEVLLFEANAAMAIVPADPAPMWDYRRPAIGSALGAVRRMLSRRLGATG